MSEPRGKPDDWTYAEYARLPDDGNHYEVIDGEVLVTPAPSTGHQHAAGMLFRLLADYADRQDLGVVLYDVDVLFVTGQYLRPDLVFVPKSRIDGLSNRGVEVAPELIVEVLSPSSRSIDLVKKPARYQDFGVPEYWVVDPADRVIWKWDFRAAAAAERCTESVRWQPDTAIPALEIPIGEVLRPLARN
jgi:Uma2 family endonuclease